jgi:hypothetical protein
MESPKFINYCDDLARKGKKITFWWRDDDAIEETQALQKLLKLVDHKAISIATIPEYCTKSLIDIVKENPYIHLLQHGVSHENFAHKEEKKCEFPTHLSDEHHWQRIQYGRDKIFQLYPEWDGKGFVPPWNRMKLNSAEGLKDIGFDYISAFESLKARNIATKHIAYCDSNIDPIDWKGNDGKNNYGFIGWQACDDILLHHAQYQQHIGLLTHHLVHNEAMWHKLEIIADFMHHHPAIDWQAPNYSGNL